MSKIQNHAHPGDEVVEAVRNAIEFRGTWMGLIFDEMRKAGVDAEAITRRAIKRCGREMHGPIVLKAAEGREVNGEDIYTFSFREQMRKVFEMDPVTFDEDNANAYLHYCPLVTAWQKMGFSDEDIALLCDITMDGDRGVAEACGFNLHLGCTIGSGCSDKCNIHFWRNELKE
ncbi:MAG: L-2-amino-thiazoline-4-carboxylic acid hydrolase [Oscillospiraceae bacterium]|nr:L-2-amino-thiazoline-4-carboxylic acid hydrolase [Oscillospiraceae bacterium]